MKKKLISLGMAALILAAIAAAVITACVNGIPDNPFLQLPAKGDDPPISLPDTVSYTIVIDMIDNEPGDTITAAPETGEEGETITLEYTVADIAHYDLLDFGGVTTHIDSVDNAGSGARTYTINADDAIDGTIIIIATFEHTDLIPDHITFNDPAPIITETYGEAFANAVCADHSGTGAVTYSSSDETVAEVDDNGEVTIHKVGTAVITAEKAADAVYAHASVSYTLHVVPRDVTITGLSAGNKVYDGTTTATVIGTAEINGMVNGDDVTVETGTAEFADANVGSNKIVAFSGWSLGGSAAGNYVLSAQPANVTANITKANPTVTWPTGLTATYGQTIANISLPGNGTGSPAGTFTWTTPSNSVGDLGTRSHNMTFTPTNTTNYNTLTNNVNIRVLLGVEMVRVGAGSFQMGQNGNGSSDNVTPVHTVTLTSFYIGKYEVTQAQYQTVMGTNPSDFTSGADAGETQNRRPVETVSWYDAVVFCNKLSMAEGLSPAYRINGSTDPAAWGTVPTSSDATWNAAVIVAGSNGYRLPTEAQWEYAAKGGPLASNPVNIWAGVNVESALVGYAWYSSNSGSKTHEVGKKLPNELGIYDMSGNVYEWCWDWYGSYSSDAQTDPVGASSGSYRVRRGGQWGHSATGVRSADRSNSNPNYWYHGLGFRLLRP